MKYIETSLSPLGLQEIKVLGSLSPEQAAIELRRIGEEKDASLLDEAAKEDITRGNNKQQKQWAFHDRAWQYTSHTLGYLAPEDRPGRDLLPIHHASNIKANQSLKNSRVTVILDRLRIAKYPGGPDHNILLSFTGRNNLPRSVEHLHLNAFYSVREDGHATPLGHRIFVGLCVGSEGISLGCRTIKIGNKEDEILLRHLESDIYHDGLRLLEASQPTIPLFSSLSASLTLAVASRNALIQQFYLGLDLGHHVMGARLAEGSYIAVQIPDTRLHTWAWDQWAYDPVAGRVMGIVDGELKNIIPYNYLVFSIRQYEGE